MFSFTTTPTRQVHLHPALTYLRLADLVCQTLADHRVDCAPLSWLSHTLGEPTADLRTTMDYALHLGICTDGTDEVVYCLPRQPIAAGFIPAHSVGHMQLRLPGQRLRPALLITGHRVGPVPESERGTTLGTGELAYTVARLTSMAASWLPDSPDPTRYLFELIAEAWWHASGTRHLGGLGIHRVNFEQPIASGPEVPGETTNRLELVTDRHLTGHELLNLYPIPARGVTR
ncbi:hypothetical protein GCM10023321_40870 [Pseudonocardia eucalypti]|uniref:Uncharacterized protein n=1 Tax=Pseudonocardia eucalypti TaxID=648755 RepID=A0ABP9QCE4_9PSEU|nr:hypothetical protein [Pseudonocardia eucalypti]